MLVRSQCHPNSKIYSSIANYLPISALSVLSQVFERLMSVRLRRFRELSGVFPTTQFDYRKGSRTCDAPFLLTPAMQLQEVWIMQIAFRATFDRVKYREFSKGSNLWVFEVLCCLYWHGFCQIDHYTFSWAVVGVNWLMWSEEVVAVGQNLKQNLAIHFHSGWPTTSECFSYPYTVS